MLRVISIVTILTVVALLFGCGRKGEPASPEDTAGEIADEFDNDDQAVVVKTDPIPLDCAQALWDEIE